jgi:hypothetical protein
MWGRMAIRALRPAMIVLCFLATPARGLDVVACSQSVPAGESGVLQADLDCSTSPIGVYVEGGASLQLNGHAITGAHHDPLGSLGVACPAGCVVTGPGEVAGFDVGVTATNILEVNDLDVHDCGVGVTAPRIRAANVTSNDNADFGFGFELLRGTGVTANGNGEYGFYGPHLVATALTANGNTEAGLSIFEGMRGTNVAVSGNGTYGMAVGRLVATGLTVTGNADVGIYATALRLRDSDVTGNNGFGSGIDLVTDKPPRLLRTACGKSLRPPSPEAPFPTGWGVCPLD